MPPVELPNDLTQMLDQIADVDLKTTIETAAKAQLQLRARRNDTTRARHPPRKQQ